MEARFNKRIKRDLDILKKQNPEFEVEIVDDNLKVWKIKFEAPKDSLFKGEKYVYFK